MSNLIINEQPIIILPSLAAALGLTEAAIIQELHFWCGAKGKEHEGRKWYEQTGKEWAARLLWLSASTIDRTLKRLEKQGYIEAKKLDYLFGGNKFGQTKYYTLNYQAIDALELQGVKTAFRQNDKMESVKPTQPRNGAVCQNDEMDSSKCSEASETAFSHSDDMDSCNLVSASSQSDDFSSSQSDELRTRQNDEMLLEINKNSLEGGEVNTSQPDGIPTPPAASALNLSVFDDSAQLANRARFFPMFAEWQPSPQFQDMCRMQQVNLAAMDEAEQSDVLAEFVSFWQFSRPNIEDTVGGWDNRFVKNIKKHLSKKHHGTPVASSGKQATRAAVTASVMNISDTDW